MKTQMFFEFKPDVNHPKVVELGVYDFFVEILRRHLDKGHVLYGMKSLTGQYFIETDGVPLDNITNFVKELEMVGGVCLW